MKILKFQLSRIIWLQWWCRSSLVVASNISILTYDDFILFSHNLRKAFASIARRLERICMQRMSSRIQSSSPSPFLFSFSIFHNLISLKSFFCCPPTPRFSPRSLASSKVVVTRVELNVCSNSNLLISCNEFLNHNRVTGVDFRAVENRWNWRLDEWTNNH